jgi:hypothetical protein
MQMRLGHSSAGDVMIVVAPLPLTASPAAPSSHGRPMCPPPQPPQSANIASPKVNPTIAADGR